jgi:hypothetical protein
MKKLVLLSFALMTSAVIFTSCQKDYTCTCTGDGNSYPVTYHTTKKKAKDACSALGSVYGTGYTCEVK